MAGNLHWGLVLLAVYSEVIAVIYVSPISKTEIQKRVKGTVFSAVVKDPLDSFP